MSAAAAETNLDLSIVGRDAAAPAAATATIRRGQLADAVDGISRVGGNYGVAPTDNRLSYLHKHETNHVAAAIGAVAAVTLEEMGVDYGKEDEKQKQGKETEKQEVVTWRRERVRHSSTINASKDSGHRLLVGTNDTPATVTAVVTPATVPEREHRYPTAVGAVIESNVSERYLRGMRHLGDEGEGDEAEFEVQEEGGTYVSADGSGGYTGPLVPGFCPLAPFERYAKMQGDIMEGRAEQRWGANTQQQPSAAAHAIRS